MEARTRSHHRWRLLRDYLLGLVLGGIGVWAFWTFYPGFWKVPVDAEVAAAAQQREALQVRARPMQPVAEEPQRAPAATASACGFEPLIPAAGPSDGKVRAEHPFPAGPRAKAKVFLRIAQRASASGRPRDAEVALIAACRYSEEASTRPAEPLARVLRLLGDHYVAAAGRDATELRQDLMSRARDVLALSAVTYAKAFGPNAARSREARRHVDAIDEPTALLSDSMAPEDAAPGTSDRAAADAIAPPPRPGISAAMSRPERSAASAAPSTAPVGRHGSSERRDGDAGPGASDPELAQLASDLARLRAQAERVTSDPEGLQRRAERASRERAQCRDLACLRAWHARRRQELLAEF